MEWIAVANLFVSAIASIAAVVQAHNSNHKKTDIIRKAKKIVDNPYKRGGGKLVNTIDHELLSALTVKAENEARQLLTTLYASKDIDEINKLIADAKTRICFFLEQIRIHNKNELPTVRLTDLWASHNCKACKEAKID